MRLGPIPGSGGRQWYAGMTRNNSILPREGFTIIAIQAVCMPEYFCRTKHIEHSHGRSGDPATIAVRPAFPWMPWDQT